jgi:hypothetical protein
MRRPLADAALRKPCRRLIEYVDDGGHLTAAGALEVDLLSVPWASHRRRD